MLGKNIDPNKEPICPESLLQDKDKQEFINVLSSFKEKDFPLKSNFEKYRANLTDEEIITIKLIKLLFWLGYYKEVFLNFGLIIESKLCNLANLYIQNNWSLSISDSSINKNRELNEFINKHTLATKAEKVRTLNLFNNQEKSDLIANRLYLITTLRNYGGHFKVNDFLKNYIDDETKRNKELEDALYLIGLIDEYLKDLVANSPR